MHIRTAAPSDADALATLLTELDYPSTPEAARARLEKFAGREDCCALVATDEHDRPVALASAQLYPSLERDTPSGTITAMVVSKAARRTGVGRELVAAVEAFLRERGCVRVTVGSQMRRTDAHAFYEALGYQRTGFRFAHVLVMMMAMLAASCASTRPSSTHVDHVILGVSDLDAGVREFESLTGVHAVFGGKHPGRGTQNALVSLGAETYLEIIAPQPGATPEGFGELAKLEHLTPVGWAVFAPDVAAVRDELARAGIRTSEPRPGARATPSGATLHWSTFGVVEPKLETAPFFIHWDDLAVHPAKTSPGGCTLERLEVGEPGIERLIDALHLKVHKTPGVPMGLTLRCGERTLSFPR